MKTATPSPVIAGELLYYVNGKGETFVFELGSDPKQISINLVTTDEEAGSSCCVREYLATGPPYRQVIVAEPTQ